MSTGYLTQTPTSCVIFEIFSCCYESPFPMKTTHYLLIPNIFNLDLSKKSCILVSMIPEAVSAYSIIYDKGSMAPWYYENKWISSTGEDSWKTLIVLVLSVHTTMFNISQGVNIAVLSRLMPDSFVLIWFDWLQYIHLLIFTTWKYWQWCGKTSCCF